MSDLTLTFTHKQIAKWINDIDQDDDYSALVEAGATVIAAARTKLEGER